MAEELKYRRGVYNREYFSGSQAALYIGDIFVDEITSYSFEVMQRRRPIYGYASTYYDALSKGQLIIQGSFSINFKEAGYLWLVLNHYRDIMSHPGGPSVLSAFKSSSTSLDTNIERFVNNQDVTLTQKLSTLRELTEYAALTGFASTQRASGIAGTRAENAFEAFEDAVWGQPQQALDEAHRRCDDPALNPFDIFFQYGDFAGDNSVNHTIRKLSDVAILGFSQGASVDDESPIQEIYQFIARSIV